MGGGEAGLPIPGPMRQRRLWYVSKEHFINTLKNLGSLEGSLRNVDLRSDLAWKDARIAWCCSKMC